MGNKQKKQKKKTKEQLAREAYIERLTCPTYPKPAPQEVIERLRKQGYNI